MPDDFSKEFKQYSVAEFFKKNRQMLGFSGAIRSLTTIIHEYVSNSLDACEVAGILPDLFVQIDQLGNEHYKVIMQDNGRGIPKSQLANAFARMLSGTKFHQQMQQRGQQGIGGSACTMFSQITTGKPIKVKSGTGDGKSYECEVMIDIKENKPRIFDEKDFNDNFQGVRIEAEFKEVKYVKGEKSPLEYLRRTALANPHAKITFVEPDGNKVTFPRASDVIPQVPKSIQPHPLGVIAHDILEMAKRTQSRKISSFLMQDLARVSSAKIKELDTLLNSDPNGVKVDLEKRPSDMTWQDAEAIVNAFRRMKWIAPDVTALRPIGEEQIVKALKNIINPEFVEVVQRKPRVYRDGIPFLVEAAITYGGMPAGTSADSVIIRFANRVPLLFDSGGCVISEAVKSIDWKRYEIDLEKGNFAIFVNFVSVYVPYTSAGKQAVSNEKELNEEIRFALMDCARRMQVYLHGKLREKQKGLKKKAIMRYINQLSVDLAHLSESQVEDIKSKLENIVESKFSDIQDDESEEESENSEEEQVNEEVEEGVGE